jgi:hypothetical protein
MSERPECAEYTILRVNKPIPFQSTKFVVNTTTVLFIPFYI